MKRKGRTASTTVCMNTGRFVKESLQHKTRNNPIEIIPWAALGFWAVNPVSYCMGVTSYSNIYR